MHGTEDLMSEVAARTAVNDGANWGISTVKP